LNKEIVYCRIRFTIQAGADDRPRQPWADTGTSTGRLMLAVLGGLADVERDLSAPAPPKAGAAPRPWKVYGPSPFTEPAQKKEAMRRRTQGATSQELARSYNVSRATICSELAGIVILN
jgi:hypothetical protein